MGIGTISTSLTSQVTLGAGNYAASLTIAAGGGIAPPGADATALYAGAGIAGVSVTNYGVISSSSYGLAVYFRSTASLTNAGNIDGATGIALAAGGGITNAGSITGHNHGPGNFGIGMNGGSLNNSGVIYGAYTGVRATAHGSIANTGSIAGHGFAGVQLFTGSNLSNISGDISGGIYGVEEEYNATLNNSGSIYGHGIGVYVSNNSTLNNSGQISGNTGVNISAGGSVENTGSISGVYDGMFLNAGASVNNSGGIKGGDVGIYASAGGYIGNAGLIGGGTVAIYSLGPLTLAAAAGARFGGAVTDRSGQGELILNGAGSLDLGGSFSGFSDIQFAPGASWVLAGTADELAGGESIAGFGAGDSIVLEGFSLASFSFISGTGLVLSNGSVFETLGISSTDVIVNALDNAVEVTGGGPACFAAGTRIATVHGNIAVEHLKIGDGVKIFGGGSAPVKWIGMRHYNAPFADDWEILPIHVQRHALGWNVPSRDLFVSPDHALCLDGVLVHAWRLVNGVSIRQVEGLAEVNYYHVELERHAVIFAENCPAESFLNADCRQRFANAAEFAALYSGAELPQAACMPRAEDGFRLHAIQQRLSARAGIRSVRKSPGPLQGFVDEASAAVVRGWARDTCAPEEPVALEVLCGDTCVGRLLANAYREDLRAAGLGSGGHGFLFRPVAGTRGPFQVRRIGDGAILPAGAA